MTGGIFDTWSLVEMRKYFHVEHGGSGETIPKFAWGNWGLIARWYTWETVINREVHGGNGGNIILMHSRRRRGAHLC